MFTWHICYTSNSAIVHSLQSSPWPTLRYYRNKSPRSHGITVKLVPIPAVLPWTMSPLPQSNRGYRGKTVIPISVQLSSPEFANCGEWGKFAASVAHTEAKRFSDSGGLHPPPLTRGSVPGPCWGLRPRYRLVLRARHVCPPHIFWPGDASHQTLWIGTSRLWHNDHLISLSRKPWLAHHFVFFGSLSILCNIVLFLLFSRLKVVVKGTFITNIAL